MNEIEAVGVEAVAYPSASGAKTGPERPWIFGLLIAPSAVVANGVIQGGVLAFLLGQRGMDSEAQAHLIFLLALPTSLYFLWSPITDFFVRRRIWLLLGSLASAIFIAAAFHQKSLTSASAEVLFFLGACCVQLVVSSCGGMMGALHTERSRRVSSGFYQGGSLAFGAAAVSVLIWMSSRFSLGAVGWAAAAMTAVPALLAFVAPAQDAIAEANFGDTMRLIWSEFKATFLRWAAVPYTLVMLFPIATGGAVALLTDVAKAYGVNGDQVAWMNGFGGAVLMAGGSLAATLIPARFRASVAYLTVALCSSATLGVLWLGPLVSTTYYLGLTLYLFSIGASYALFTAVVLEFLGKSGKSGSGRYSIINSLGNVPVLYMVILDGRGGKTWGPRGVSGTECVMGAVGAMVLLGYFLFFARNRAGGQVVGA